MMLGDHLIKSSIFSTGHDRVHWGMAWLTSPSPREAICPLGSFCSVRCCFDGSIGPATSNVHVQLLFWHMANILLAMKVKEGKGSSGKRISVKLVWKLMGQRNKELLPPHWAGSPPLKSLQWGNSVAFVPQPPDWCSCFFSKIKWTKLPEGALCYHGWTSCVTRAQHEITPPLVLVIQLCNRPLVQGHGSAMTTGLNSLRCSVTSFAMHFADFWDQEATAEKILHHISWHVAGSRNNSIYANLW